MMQMIDEKVGEMIFEDILRYNSFKISQKASKIREEKVEVIREVEDNHPVAEEVLGGVEIVNFQRNTFVFG